MMNKTVLLITVSCVSLYTGALSYADIYSYHTPPRLSGAADTKSHNLYTPHLVAAHLSSPEDFSLLPSDSFFSHSRLDREPRSEKTANSFNLDPRIKSEDDTSLVTSLLREEVGLRSRTGEGDKIKLASVCFVTDTGDCSGNEFSNADSEDGHGAPGGPGDDFDLDNAERCRQEGYTQTSCPEDSDPVNFCPYDNTYFERCQANCPSNYVTCEPPYYGVGEACGDKYASCEKDTERACQELNPGYTDNCGSGQKLSDDRCSYDNSYGICCDTCSGYPYTADSIPNGYVQDGEACVDCDGNQKVKVKPNPCDGFMDCGSVGPETGANTCLSGTTTLYDNCKPCPNLGIYDSCPSPYTCSFEDCSNKYYPTGCKSGYVWNANNKTCTCDTSVYKYACTGTDQKGSGQACDGKYKSCTCSNGKTWNGKECVCDSSYKYTCNGTNESPSGTSCGGKYKSCYCSGAYDWDGSSCSCSSSYRYTCTGTNETGGKGTSCDGKYEGCFCKSPLEWKSGYCRCPSDYWYSCSGLNETGGIGAECDGYYKECSCGNGTKWSSTYGRCQCSDSSYKYTCRGTNESGVGTGCYQGTTLYYKSCKCSSGYWSSCDGKCVNRLPILFSDMTQDVCAPYPVCSKTPIGVVVAPGMALSLNVQSSGTSFGGEGHDVPNIPNYSSVPATESTSGKQNTAAFIAYGKANGISYPVVELCYKYSTKGTSAGDWYLPSASECVKGYASQIQAVYDTLVYIEDKWDGMSGCMAKVSSAYARTDNSVISATIPFSTSSEIDSDTIWGCHKSLKTGGRNTSSYNSIDKSRAYSTSSNYNHVRCFLNF